MRITVVAAICLCIVGMSTSAAAQAAIRKQTNIPAQGLGPALQVLAKDRNLQMVYRSEVIGKLRTDGAAGEFTTDEAVTELLKGTGLAFRYLGENAITIVPAGASADAVSGPSSTAIQSPASNTSDEQPQEGKKSIWDSFRLAQANLGSAQRSSAVGSDVSSGSSEKSSQLTEILVTAQKKSEREQDVPIAMTVLDPAELAQSGQARLQDYFASVPGLSLAGNSNGAGTSYVTIRGLSAGDYQNPTVATVVDDVPVGSSLILALGSLTQPDLDPSDLARIEVLKGPQGTLYGADSLGGLIKYVTVDPSTSTFSGRAEMAGAYVPGGGAGYTVRAAGNIPLSEVFALRVSGFDRRDPGYIDDLTTGRSNINSADVYGGHVSLLYRPSENFSIKLGALIQNTDANGSGFVNSDSMLRFPQGDLKQTGLPGTNPYETRWQLYTATLNAKVAGLDVVSVTGYNTNLMHSAVDTTGCCGGFFNTVASQVFPGVPGPSGSYVNEHYYTEKLSQETRLSSSIQHWLDWTAGAFYTHEVSPGGSNYNQNVAADLASGAGEGVLVNYSYPLRFTEYAAFGDLTFHVTNRFDIQIGGRQSWSTTHYDPVYTGPGLPAIFGVPSPDIHPPGTARGTPFTYLVTPKYEISKDLQVYARIASGYRLGGPNLDAGTGADRDVPLYYKPDKTTNYEIGIKGEAFDHILSFAAAAYYIDWKNFQLNVSFPTPFGTENYTANAGDAKSDGVEMSVDVHPVTGLTLGVQGSYNNAVLTQDLPAATVAAGAYGVAGDRLPYSIKFSGGFTANQDIPLPNDWMGFVGGAINYIGPRPYEFATAPPPTQRVWIPGYTQLNLRTGLRHQSWLVNLYANNVTDRRGIIGYYAFAGNLDAPGGIGTVIRPRTIGLSVARQF